MNKDTVIDVKNLHINFYNNNRCNEVIMGVDFSLKRGKILCIVGESGCGKSVTANSIMRLLPSYSRIEDGEIHYYCNNEDIRIDRLSHNAKELRKIRGEEISMIFQDPMQSLNPVLTIGDQITEILLAHDYCKTKKEARTIVIQSLRELGIAMPEKRVDEYPHQFSGGMCQRVMIAMAMILKPKVLLADEPTTALDVTIQAQIFDLMLNLKNNHDTAILLITHDMGVVAELADDVAVMYMGNIVESGSAYTVLTHPKHPYTKALLESIPVLGKGKQQRPKAIKGNTPSPYNRPKGCQFYSRCAYATDRCKVCMPPKQLITENHHVRCFNYEEV